MRPLGSPLPGDRAHGITMPLPQSLKTLEDCARRYFGHAGKLQLFHQGQYPILRDQQLAQIRDGDTIILTWDDKKLTTKEVNQMLTTHQADFRVPPRTALVERVERPPAEAYVPHRVTEQTSYMASYTQQPFPEQMQAPCNPRDMYPVSHQHETGTSSYSAEFAAPAHPARPRGIRQSEETARNPKFDGETTYSTMYQPPKVTGAPGRPSASVRGYNLTEDRAGGHKFEGTSTYRSNFPPPAAQPGAKGAPMGGGDYKPARFGGSTSEYRQEYEKKEIVGPMITLMPEEGVEDIQYSPR